MFPDRKQPAAENEQQVVEAYDQLTGDLEHLRKLQSNLQRTREVLLKAAAAYRASQQLLLNIEAAEL